MKSITLKRHSIQLMPVCKRLSIAVILFFSVLGVAMAGSGNGEKLSKPHGGDRLNFAGANSFIHQFPTASDITYKVKGQFTEVNFIWNDMKLQAFYDYDGNLLATCRPVPAGNLPLAAQLSLRDQYPGCLTREVVEYNDPNDGVSYYLTIVTPKSAYLLHVSTSGTISVFKKMKN